MLASLQPVATSRHCLWKLLFLQNVFAEDSCTGVRTAAHVVRAPAEREEINKLRVCAIATFVAVPSLVLVVVLNLSIVSRGCADGRSQLQGLCTEFVLVCLHLVFVGVRSTLFVCLLSESLLRVLHRRSRVVVVLLECVGKAARAKAGGPARPLRTCLRVARAMWFVSMCQTVCDRWSQR
jgi:hypothetical protein